MPDVHPQGLLDNGCCNFTDLLMAGLPNTRGKGSLCSQRGNWWGSSCEAYESCWISLGPAALLSAVYNQRGAE